MIKKNIYKVCLAICGAMLTTACGDSFLDHTPDERIELNASTLTDVQCINMINASYPGANYGWIGELSSDNIIDNNAPHMPTSTNSDQKETHLNLNSMDRFDDELFEFEPCVSAKYQDTPYFIWEDEYSSIAMTNVIINLINEHEQLVGKENLSPIKKAVRGEAKILRAYCHYILVNIFSQAYKDDNASKNDIGIPYVTDVETTVRVEYDRSNVADVYAKIAKDLEEGMAELNDTHMEKPKWHFNIAAANAFAARFYLSYHKYDKVIEHANNVLGNGPVNVSNKLMSYEPFSDYVYAKDFATYFQSPDNKNNLMLITSLSYNFYHAIGYRYAMNGEAARAVFFHPTPTSGNLIIHPAAVASYQYASYSSEDADYGYYSFKIYYVFEYSDKISGTGQAHQVRREFTNTLLLLERAEAKILTGDYDGAVSDMADYEASRLTIGNTLKKAYDIKDIPLTKEMILDWYDPATHGINNPALTLRQKHENTLDNSAYGWGNAKHMGINIPDAAVPYMNCLNDMRRYETMWDGMRFFDLKRWGIKYSHIIGPQSKKIELDWDDARRAVEAPLEARTAGMESSRTKLSTESPISGNARVSLPESSMFMMK